MVAKYYKQATCKDGFSTIYLELVFRSLFTLLCIFFFLSILHVFQDMQTEAWLLVLLSKHRLTFKKNKVNISLIWYVQGKIHMHLAYAGQLFKNSLNRGAWRKNHSHKLRDNFCKKKVQIIVSNRN